MSSSHIWPATAPERLHRRDPRTSQATGLQEEKGRAHPSLLEPPFNPQSHQSSRNPQRTRVTGVAGKMGKIADLTSSAVFAAGHWPEIQNKSPPKAPIHAHADPRTAYARCVAFLEVVLARKDCIRGGRFNVAPKTKQTS